MSMIFRDASATLKAIHTPPRKPHSSTKPSRLPLSQDRSVRFGHIGYGDRIAEPYDTKASKVLETGESPVASKPAWTKSLTSRTDCQSQTRSGLNADSGIDDPASNCLPKLPSHDSATALSQAADSLEEMSRGDDGREPISSGFATPSASCSQPARTPDEIIYPEFGQWQLPPSPSGEDSLVLSSPTAEETQSAKITSWLHSLPKSSGGIDPITRQQGSSMEGVPLNVLTPLQKASRIRPRTPQRQSPTLKPEEGRQSRSGASSNKENVSPSKLTPSPARSRIPQTTTPSRFRSSNIPASAETTATLHFTHPQTPQGHLSLPPKRKKFRVGGEVKPDPPRSGSKDFTIHDDQLANALAQLSPDVELRRKGRRPKRDRCVSYWDEDILPSGSPCLPAKTEASSVPMRKGKEVLSESQHTAELTKEKPFAAEAENAGFDFQVGVSNESCG